MQPKLVESQFGYAPLVAAAWCFTAALSRLNSLSTTHEGSLESEWLKRRVTERAGAKRWAGRERRSRRWASMVGEKQQAGGEDGRDGFNVGGPGHKRITLLAAP